MKKVICLFFEGQRGVAKFNAVAIIRRWLFFASHSEASHLRLLAEIWHRMLGILEI